MFFQQSSVSALAAITFLTHASTSLAGHARRQPLGHHHVARELSARQDLGCVGQLELDVLKSETTAFQGWIETWFNTSDTIDYNTAVSQLQQEYQAYNGWISAWLDSAMASGVPAPSLASAIPTSVPMSTGTKIHTRLPVPSSAPAVPPYPLPSAASSLVGTGTAPGTAGTAPSIPSSAPTGIINSLPPVASSSVPAPEKVHSSISASLGSIGGQQTVKPSTFISVPASSAPVVASSAPVNVPTVSASAVSTPAPTGGSTSSSGSFNAGASNNLAVYYGQTDASSSVTLAQQCADASVDIVILAFLTEYFGPGNYPTLNFGGSCSSPNSAQSAKGATGLLSCPDMATAIKTCQSNGKKVLLSLGGATGTSKFSSDSQASTFATQLWNLFGGGTGEDSNLRPFGDVKLDGFDIDDEDQQTASYGTFVSSLRSTMGSGYYISAAPQCPFPDASNPLSALQSMDFVWVQFYNNGPCNVGQSGFLDSFKQWSSQLSSGSKGPKLYIGAPGCSACAGSGYLAPSDMSSVISSAKSAGVSNFGGVMLWDGPSAIENGDYDKAVKSAL